MKRGLIRIRRKPWVTRLRLCAHSNRATYGAKYFLWTPRKSRRTLRRPVPMPSMVLPWTSRHRHHRLVRIRVENGRRSHEAALRRPGILTNRPADLATFPTDHALNRWTVFLHHATPLPWVRPAAGRVIHRCGSPFSPAFWNSSSPSVTSSAQGERSRLRRAAAWIG